MKAATNRDGEYMRRYLRYVFAGDPHPGKPPRRVAEAMAEAVRRFNDARPARERRIALHAAYIAGGGTEEGWGNLNVRAEQTASRATGGQYTREQVLDILEAEIVG